MRITSACKKYFNSLTILCDHENHSACENALAGLAVLTWFTGITPLLVGATYACAKGWRTITKMTSINQRTNSVGITALDTTHKLETIGGFERGWGANTCFIATALQALRQVPLVREQLKTCLQKKEDESDQQFNLRQKIQATLSLFYRKTDEGKTIKSTQFRQFHQLLYDYYNMIPAEEDERDEKNVCYISTVGTGGDQLGIVHCLMKVLGIELLEGIKKKTHLRFRCFQMETAGGRIEGFDNDGDIEKALNRVFSGELCVVQRYKIYDEENYLPLSNEIPLEFDHERGGTYVLVAATGGTTGHDVAYLKEIGKLSKDWIYCDDSSVRKVSSIQQRHRMMYLFYAKKAN